MGIKLTKANIKLTFFFAWLGMSAFFLSLFGLTATGYPEVLFRLAVPLGAITVALAALTLAMSLFTPWLKAPAFEIATSLLLAGGAGLGLIFFLNKGFGLPLFEGSITPQLTNVLILLFGALAAGWTAFLSPRENPALNTQSAVKFFTALSVIIPIGILIFFIAYTINSGAPILSWRFVSTRTDYLRNLPGILPAIMGSVWLIVGATIFAVPLGVGAAVFLTEYASRRWVKQLVGVTADCLWSTPSIVFGLFGYVFLVPRITGHSTLLAGQIILGAMLLPLTIATSTEALTAVPDEYRSGSLALGASQWWTIKKVVLPSSVPSIVTGVLLGVGRIAGETAPIMLIAVASQTGAPSFFSLKPPYFDLSALFREVDALPYHLYAIYKAGVGGSIQEAWGTALVLIGVVLFFYAFGISVRSYYRRRRGW